MVIRSCYFVLLFLTLPLTCDHHEHDEHEPNIIDEHHTGIKYTGVAFFLLFLLYGIAGNILMIAVFCTKQDNFHHLAFILIASQLIICNFISFSSQIGLVLPELLLTNISDSKLIYASFVSLLFTKIWVIQLFRLHAERSFN